jgi:hypothetical protein
MFGLLFDLVALAAPVALLLAEASGHGPCSTLGLGRTACDGLVVLLLLTVPAVRGVARARKGRIGSLLRLLTAIGLPVLALVSLGTDGAALVIGALLVIWFLATRVRGGSTALDSPRRFWSTWAVIGVTALLAGQVLQGNLSPGTAVVAMAGLLALHQVAGSRRAIVRLAMGLGVAVAALTLGSVALTLQGGVPGIEVASLVASALALELVIYLAAAFGYSR